ncbi:hypothetical protein [Kosakonia sp. S42]|uniref:hypothetical protein n=1 Tax=Kosakonia sp. S42 TaxID=2767458 RepID=UPI00190DD34F|nr:hypothetical protein [Kosakonia sp. S42]MBK0018884.1 hypothetical protein [Kosakonia sp. S42]
MMKADLFLFLETQEDRPHDMHSCRILNVLDVVEPVDLWDVLRLCLNCHMALQALQQQIFRNWNGAVVEIDIQKYF